MYDQFFAYARERYQILLKRRRGDARPWTTDPILSKYRFCNVFREDDITTMWMAEHVRQPLRDKPECLLATVLFRWFNRITTGEAIFSQTVMTSPNNWATPWELYLKQGRVDFLKTSILTYCEKGPYVTGAYCIIGSPNMPKLDGILDVFRLFATTERPCDFIPDRTECGWRKAAEAMLARRGKVTLEQVWDWLRRYPRSGDFMAYEVVCDLMYTELLNRAPDRMTWANAGPGAIRGLNRIHDRPLEKRLSKSATCAEMRDILEASQDPSNWPSAWPAWDMRTVEHSLCESDKYQRIRLGQGRVKGVYR
jgi:alpha-glutamyl/putrescinyl thymine pyrophosphorylase clade 1